jgi:hypothetical protein
VTTRVAKPVSDPKERVEAFLAHRIETMPQSALALYPAEVKQWLMWPWGNPIQFDSIMMRSPAYVAASELAAQEHLDTLMEFVHSVQVKTFDIEVIDKVTFYDPESLTVAKIRVGSDFIYFTDDKVVDEGFVRREITALNSYAEMLEGFIKKTVSD